MSAFVVSNSHINLIVSAAIERSTAVRFASVGTLMIASEEIAEVIGVMLLKENIRSVVHRYRLAGSLEEEGYRQELADYRFRFYHGIRPSAVAQALSCCDYQACECDDYLESPARFFVTQLASAVGEPAGFDAEPWGFDSHVDVLAAAIAPPLPA